jgi:hypothetical protein
MELIEISFEHPLMREMYGVDKELHILGFELRNIIMRTVKELA